MYIFELSCINPFYPDTEIIAPVEIDSTPLEVTELEIYQMAMEKAYLYCKNNEYEFISLSLVAC